MDEKHLRKLLKEFKAGRKDAETVLTELKSLPFRDLGFARLDTHRETAEMLNIPGFEKKCRQGLKEIKRGKGKKLNK